MRTEPTQSQHEDAILSPLHADMLQFEAQSDHPDQPTLDFFHTQLEQSMLFPKSLLPSLIRVVDDYLEGMTYGLTDSERRFIRFTIGYENYIKTVDDQTFFKIDNEGDHRGLAQSDRRTWNNVKAQGFKPLTLSFEDGVGTPFFDVVFMVGLYRSNRRVFLNHFKGQFNDFPSPAVAYLYHNQGARSAKAYLRGSPLVHADESDKAMALFGTIKGRGKLYV